MIAIQKNTIGKNDGTLESSSGPENFDANLFSDNLDIWAYQTVKPLGIGLSTFTVNTFGVSFSQASVSFACGRPLNTIRLQQVAEFLKGKNRLSFL